MFLWEFSKTSKTISTANLSITFKSNQLVGKIQGVWFFEETNRNKETKFLLDTLQSKKKRKEKKEEE